MTNLDVSVIAREDRALIIKSMKARGLGNAEILGSLEEIEDDVINQTIGALSEKLSYSEHIRHARPYAIMKMVRELGISVNDAERSYDSFMFGELKALGEVDEAGYFMGSNDDFDRKEIYAMTHQGPGNYKGLPKGKRGFGDDPGALSGYANTKADQFAVA